MGKRIFLDLKIVVSLLPAPVILPEHAHANPYFAIGSNSRAKKVRYLQIQADHKAHVPTTNTNFVKSLCLALQKNACLRIPVTACNRASSNCNYSYQMISHLRSMLN